MVLFDGIRSLMKNQYQGKTFTEFRNCFGKYLNSFLLKMSKVEFQALMILQQHLELCLWTHLQFHRVLLDTGLFYMGLCMFFEWAYARFLVERFLVEWEHINFKITIITIGVVSYYISIILASFFEINKLRIIVNSWVNILMWMTIDCRSNEFKEKPVISNNILQNSSYSILRLNCLFLLKYSSLLLFFWLSHQFSWNFRLQQRELLRLVSYK